MSFYKVIQSGKVIDVLQNPVFVKKSTRGHIISCDVSEASGVVSSDCSLIWHIAGKEVIPNTDWQDAELADIDEVEYKELYTLLDLGAEIPSEGDIDFGEEVEEEFEIPEDTVLTKARERYIDRMSAMCQDVICTGIDVELSDGSVQHFTLEIEDQLNLITLSSMVAAGETMIPYHASDKLCVFYSAEDITRIITAATAFKTFHTSYFNSLKNWIMSVGSIAEMSEIQYGDTIPEEYCSDVLKQLMMQAAQ
ncbi:MAG: hypothetical protein IKY16_06610 [Bacteroidales bacterium]|nr:hypothetical protein [Bacteroidales bacterium]